MIDYRRIGLWALIALTLVGVYLAMRTVEQRGHTAMPAIESPVPDASGETAPSGLTSAPATEMRANPAPDTSSTP